MEIQPEKKRRIRYSGTHPKRFEEKYKELAPQNYAADIQKVIARGQTPAGMHRSVCVEEILSVLDPKPGMVALDATLGYGGHAQELLSRITPGGRLFALDTDPIELARTETRLRAHFPEPNCLVVTHMNFAQAHQLLAQIPGGFDIILADLGVSSMQIDNPSRGFSFKFDGPLDLRLDPDTGVPASLLLSELSKESLVELLEENADEPHARVIASAIDQNKELLQTTRQLRQCIEKALLGLPPPTRSTETKKALQRTFQALRIAVNNEFGVLETFLGHLPACLKAGGKAAILTFHSGEDRRVKKSFKENLGKGVYTEVVRRPIRPSPKEQHDNPRSSCAKLRWAIRSNQAIV